MLYKKRIVKAGLMQFFRSVWLLSRYTFLLYTRLYVFDSQSDAINLTVIRSVVRNIVMIEIVLQIYPSQLLFFYLDLQHSICLSC